IKDLLVRFKGTAKEKSLLKISKLYEKAFKDAKGKTAASGAQDRVHTDADGKPFVVIDKDILQGVPKSEWVATVKNVFKEKYPNGIDMGYFNIAVNAKTRNEFLNSVYSENLRENSNSIYKDKMRMVDNLDEIIQNAYNVENESPNHSRNDNLRSFNRGQISVRFGEKDYTIETVTGINSKNNEIVYDIVNILPTKIGTSQLGVLPKQSPTNTAVPINPTISQHPSGVNTHYMQNDKKDTQNSISGGSSELVPQGQGLKIEKLNEKYGAIEHGEKPVREVSLPKRTAKDRYVSKYARTMAEAGVTNEPTVDLIKKDLAAGRLSHEVITDKKAMENAENIIREDGFKGALKTWTDVIDGKSKPTKYTLALGQTLYNEAVENKDAALVKKMIADMVLQFSEAGQNLQAARLLKRLTPDGRLYALEKSVIKINKDLNEKYSKLAPNIEIPTALAQKLLDAENKREVDIAVEAIQQCVASQIPATWRDKFNAWRYVSMLGNMRTHIKNILGNMIFVPVRQFKNIIGIVPERVLLPQEQRTKSLVNPFDKENKRLKAFAENDFDLFQNEIKGESKYDISSGIQDKRKIFKTKLLENARNFNFNALGGTSIMAFGVLT
ncbi:MAG: hypothetical protein RR654_01405, partial [Oscillospiraceae bacterium]